MADIAAALYGLLGVFVALCEREQTGRGQRVDGTLYESTAHLMGYWLTYADLLDRVRTAADRTDDPLTEPETRQLIHEMYQ